MARCIFEGKRVSGLKGHEVAQRGIAQSPEGRRIFPRMTVTENLELGAFLRNDKAEIAADMDRVFDLFPRLKERLAQKSGTLSGGEQQMLAMGRALMAQPRLLLLDEPSMGLAPVLVDVVFETIRKVNEQGTTVLLVEQNALVALNIADHALRARDRPHHARGPCQGTGPQRRGSQGLPRRGVIRRALPAASFDAAPHCDHCCPDRDDPGYAHCDRALQIAGGAATVDNRSRRPGGCRRGRLVRDLRWERSRRQRAQGLSVGRRRWPERRNRRHGGAGRRCAGDHQRDIGREASNVGTQQFDGGIAGREPGWNDDLDPERVVAVGRPRCHHELQVCLVDHDDEAGQRLSEWSDAWRQRPGVEAIVTEVLAGDRQHTTSRHPRWFELERRRDTARLDRLR